jgi:orotidine-5'-phosphate decarboxylase
MASTVAEMVTAAVHKTCEMIKVHGSEGADQLAGRRTLLEYVVNIIEVRLI